MSNEPSHFSPVFRIDVSAEPSQAPGPSAANDPALMTVALLRQLISTQERQNQLLEQLVQQSVQGQKQRASELQQWKDANPRLSKACRRAAETLAKVQAQFLESLTDEVQENEEDLVDGEFVLNEFVDRFGPRLAHLNGVLQVLAQLGSGVPIQG
jgi:exonuclease VII large subunit